MTRRQPGSDREECRGTRSIAAAKQFCQKFVTARAAPGLNRKGDAFRVYRSSAAFGVGAERNLFVTLHRYFVTVPWDSNYYYWDYQAMRQSYGAEMGASRPIGLPAAPHPWCTQSGSDILPLVEYVLTL
jgi:hypothetical protein